MNNLHINHRLLPLVIRRVPIGMRGKSRAARWLLGSMLDSQDVSVIASDGTCYLVPCLREPVGFHLLIDGIYEPLSMQFLIRHFVPGSTFIDIGANIGLFAIAIARYFDQNSQVIAVEPSPKVFSYLKKNIQLNALKNVQALELALADQDEMTRDFYEPPIAHFGMGSLSPQFHVAPTEVKTKTVDTLVRELAINKVHLIKVDVEGHEADVFKGGKQLFSSTLAPVVLFEFCDWAEQRAEGTGVGDAQRILRDYGYQLWRLEEYMKKKPALTSVLTTGSAMLVGIKP